MKKLGFAVIALAASLAAAPGWAQTPQTSTAATPSRAVTAPATPAKPAAATATSTKAPLVDINTASQDELDVLPGIGPARAAAIIKGRPYKGKDELLRKKVIPANAYNGIKDRIIAKQS